MDASVSQLTRSGGWLIGPTAVTYHFTAADRNSLLGGSGEMSVSPYDLEVTGRNLGLLTAIGSGSSPLRRRERSCLGVRLVVPGWEPVPGTAELVYRFPVPVRKDGTVGTTSVEECAHGVPTHDLYAARAAALRPPTRR
jgi:hypothetical protein